MIALKWFAEVSLYISCSSSLHVIRFYVLYDENCTSQSQCNNLSPSHPPSSAFNATIQALSLEISGSPTVVFSSV